ncbi:MAG: hypothetical protein ACLR4Z_09090 [Butyricicoccaceae bacterium]
MLAGAALCLAAFCGERALIRLGGLYFLTAAAFAGLAAALGAVSENSGCCSARACLPFRCVCCCSPAALGYTLSGILLRGDAKHGSIRRDIGRSPYAFRPRTARARAGGHRPRSLRGRSRENRCLFCARGEASLLLNDPLDGDAAQQLTALPAETAAHCGLVPYRAVGTESGLLLYFRPDRVLEADGTTLDCVVRCRSAQLQSRTVPGPDLCVKGENHET